MRPLIPLLALAALLAPAAPARAALPAHLPRYRLTLELDIAGHAARGRLEATWTNPTATPTDRLVLNAHGRYVVPGGQVGFMAKMLEILRVQPGEALGTREPPVEVTAVRLPGQPDPTPLPYRFEGKTQTDLVIDLPRPVGAGESVTVLLDLAVKLPQKQGRWGQWQGVTTLSNWLPVFAYYGEKNERQASRERERPEQHTASESAPLRSLTLPARPRSLTLPARPRPRVVRAAAAAACWQPVPFIPWHQPFFNEAGVYDVELTLPADQHVACTGAVIAETLLPGGKKSLTIRAAGVREWTVVASARYVVHEAEVAAGPGGRAVRTRVLAFPEHAFYAKHILRIAGEALVNYSKWFGPYPWPEFTIPECYFGWNGNECSTLVMIDERVFAMPHIAVGYVEYLVSHEVSHQWWYNLVGTNGFAETWMDEAMANYFTHRFLDRKLGRNNQLMNYPGGLSWLPTIRREDYRSTGMYGTIGRGEHARIVKDMSEYRHLVDLFNHCYDKGGRVAAMIEARLAIESRLGEAAFLDFTRRVCKKYAYRILRVADYQRELEEYTNQSWEEFFDGWLYGTALSDWSVEEVTVTAAPLCVEDCPVRCQLRRRRLLARGVRGEGEAPAEPKAVPPGGCRVEVIVHQRADFDEPTSLGLALPNGEGYPIRVPILPRAAAPYSFDDPPATVTPLPPGPKGGARLKVEVVLPAEPSQVAVDPDQVLVDADPSNNFWHTAIRWRLTPLYTFLEETDLTNAYDRWNVIAGPWLFSPPYNDAWFTRSTMVGARVGAYRTQQFQGGAYVGLRTDFRDIVAGFDGMWDHWPFDKSQTGFIVERRLQDFNKGDSTATRAVLWSRRIFTYGSSLYLPPIHYLEGFAQYSDNFLPFPTEKPPLGVRYDRTATLGLHYRLNYQTPYWSPEGGFQVDGWTEGGLANDPKTVGLMKAAGQLVVVKSPPNLADAAAEGTWLWRGLDWLSDTRLALRAYGGVALPREGEFYSMGGPELFRAFDLAQRQGSTVWVASAEWRVPLARRLNLDAVDHVMGLRNAYLAAFYDVGDTYTKGRSVGPVAHGVGLGLRLDVAWFGFVERTTLRLDVAKAVHSDTGVQVWVGVNHPF